MPQQTPRRVCRRSRRGEALSGLFLICYAGMSLPAVGIGIAVNYISLTTAVSWFSATLLVVLAATTILTRRANMTPGTR